MNCVEGIEFGVSFEAICKPRYPKNGNFTAVFIGKVLFRNRSDTPEGILLPPL